MIGFGEFGEKRNLEITTLLDERLMMIDPTIEGFYDKVLQFKTENEQINLFIEAVREVQEARLTRFWIPIMDPSENNGKIIYMKGEKPAVGHSYNWWKDKPKGMLPVEGRKWYLKSEYEYYADKVDLINKLEVKGYYLYEAIKKVVEDSTEFGHYANSVDAKNDFEPTGSREVCGRYDLVNTFKILSCTNGKVSEYWIASGNCFLSGYDYQLANLIHCNSMVCGVNVGVGEFVLK